MPLYLDATLVKLKYAVLLYRNFMDKMVLYHNIEYRSAGYSSNEVKDETLMVSSQYVIASVMILTPFQSKTLAYTFFHFQKQEMIT